MSSFCKDKLILVSENQKYLYVKNDAQEEVLKERISTDNLNPRCDYRLRLVGKWDIFVELKGKDTKHALEQILATAEDRKTKKDSEDRIGAIICSKVPKIDTEYQQARRKKSAKIIHLGFREILRKNKELRLAFKDGKLKETK